jgi:hypothetical protein
MTFKKLSEKEKWALSEKEQIEYNLKQREHIMEKIKQDFNKFIQDFENDKIGFCPEHIKYEFSQMDLNEQLNIFEYVKIANHYLKIEDDEKKALYEKIKELQKIILFLTQCFYETDAKLKGKM